MKRKFIVLSVIFFLFANGAAASAAYAGAPHYVERNPLPIRARSAILMDGKTKEVIYAKDETLRVYPASITKILTVLLVAEHLDLNDYVTVGSEIETIAYDSSMAYNKIGEVMSVENMIRLIIIPSGNETSCVAALAVAKKITGDSNIPYQEAERVFSDLMNKKAKELGADNSNFVNPHGYHDNNHYTTAYDMALICRAAMENEFVRKVVAERIFSGPGAEPAGDRMVVEHNFETRNELLIPDSAYYYPYATGMKTGFTGEAGDCLAASAEKDGRAFFALAFDSPNGGRWQDTVDLFEFAFNSFSLETVQASGEVIEAVPITNPMLGDDEYLDILTVGSFEDYLTKDDMDNIEREITYSEKFITPERKKDEKQEDILDMMQFMPPIEKGEIVGKAVYSLFGEIIFESDLAASREVGERTRDTDFEYYKQKIKDNAFTVNALPYWFGGFAALFLIIQITVFIVKRKRNRGRRRSGYYGYR